MSKKIYSFRVRTLQGEEKDLEEYRDKTLLIVNTASKCGLTPQYEGLETLYQKYRDRGLEILGFPCNQFGNQEPGDEKAIEEFCQVNYGVSFPMFSKIEVNGPGTHPLYQYLKKELPGFPGGRIKWNFTKFLIDSEGKPVKRFSSQTRPEKIDTYLENYFSKQSEEVGNTI